jgi:putative GTP pyrophosphokinase
LQDEVVFALRQGLDQAGIKTHAITSRVKTLESLAAKAERKGYTDPLADARDIVGARVVTLFLSDLPRVEELIAERFAIAERENKVENGDPATFGYMSMHYSATLHEHHSGPRYDEIKGMPFEVQVRTILMDAWAGVSHYLAYKGEASIPTALRQDFFALSGLFYVADKHFEMFFKGAMESRAEAEREVRAQPEEGGEVNLSTVLALLRRKYPNREQADPESVSEFVEEATAAGYSDLRDLERALSRADPVLDAYEEERPPHAEFGRRYADVGAARTALAIADPDYAVTKYGEDARYAKYREQLSA